MKQEHQDYCNLGLETRRIRQYKWEFKEKVNHAIQMESWRKGESDNTNVRVTEKDNQMVQMGNNRK